MSETPSPRNIEQTRAEVAQIYELEKPRHFDAEDRFDLNHDEDVDPKVWTHEPPVEIGQPTREEILKESMEGMTLQERLSDVGGIGERIEFFRQAQAA